MLTLKNYNPAERLYRAENVVLNPEHRIDPAIVFSDYKAIEAFMEKIHKSDFAKANWPRFAAMPMPPLYMDLETFLLIGASGGRTSERENNPDELKIGLTPDPYAMNRLTVLHELSHVVDIREHGSPALRGDETGHGGCFASTYLVMLKEFGEAGWYSKMKKQFDRIKVPYTCSYKKPLG